MERVQEWLRLRRDYLFALLFLTLVLAAVWFSVSVLLAVGSGMFEVLSPSSADPAGREALAFFVRCAAIGALSMCLIQMARGLFPVRGAFHERAVAQWLERGFAPLLGLGWACDRFLGSQELEAARSEIARSRDIRLSEDEDFAAWMEGARERLRQGGRDLLEMQGEEFDEALRHILPRPRSGPETANLVKDLLPVFQKSLSEQTAALRREIRCASRGEPDVRSAALRALGDHALTAGRRELFDLPLGRLCGQIGAAAEMVVRDPSRNLLLLSGLASTTSALEYRDRWEREQKVGSEDTLERPNAKEDRSGDAVPPFVMARNQVEQRIQRNIDGLQIAAGLRWRRQLRLLAILVSAILAVGVLWAGDRGAGWYIRLVVTSLIAGYLASVSRDLVALIEKLRG